MQFLGPGTLRVARVPPGLEIAVRGELESEFGPPAPDARSVAIAALRHPGLTPVVVDDHARVLGLLAKRHRDVARLKNKAACRLHALLGELTASGLASEMTVNKADSLLEAVVVTDDVTRQRVVIATELVDDITRFNAQLRASKQRIRTAVAASGTSLCDIRGIGPIGAATILGAVGDITRFPTKGHFASYNATAPIDPPQGTTTDIDSTREGTENSTTSSTSLRSANSAIPARAAITTTRNWPRAKPVRKPSEH